MALFLLQFALGFLTVVRENRENNRSSILYAITADDLRGSRVYVQMPQHIEEAQMRRRGFSAIVLIIAILATLSRARADRLDEGVTAMRREDFETAMRLLRPLANQGNADAQLYVGSMLLSGQGVSQDLKEAVVWYRKAAEQGKASAQYALGTLYFGAPGMSRDDTVAAMWIGRAAEQGYAIAQSQLGQLYETGRGMPRDYALAAIWYRRAASQGLLEAWVKLGALYQFGMGVDRSLEDAYICYDLVASTKTRRPRDESVIRLAVSSRDRVALSMTAEQIESAKGREAGIYSVCPDGAQRRELATMQDCMLSGISR